MYGLRAILPQHPHVVRTMCPSTLIRQLTPGSRGTRHPLQNGCPFGIGTRVFPDILQARST